MPREPTPEYLKTPSYREVQKYSRAPPNARSVEVGKYYEVLVAPDGQIYIYWYGTTQTDIQQWYEDLAGEFAQRRIPAWDRELNYVARKYGMESSTVHHDGFSRGGAFAQHMGGIGYGSAYFPKYPPADTAQSRGADDFFHKHIVPLANEYAAHRDDPTPNEVPHTMDTDDGAFDTPVKPVVESSAPIQGIPSRGYSGFACAYVGFPARIKYDRKRNIAHQVLGGRHAHHKMPKSRKRLFSQINDSAMRKVEDTPMNM